MSIHHWIDTVDAQIARWGNSLVIRIPAEVMRRLGLREGATVQVQPSVDGGLSIRPSNWGREAFAKELEDARAGMPISGPVLADTRSGTRY